MLTCESVAEWSFEYLRRRAQISREEIIKRKVEESHLHEIENPRIGVYAGQTFTAPKITLEVTPADDDHPDNDDDDDASWHSADSSSSVLDGSDVIAFRARSEKHTGRFVVYANGVRFVRSINKHELWRRTFLELAEMRKLSSSAALRVIPKSLEQLELVFTDGTSVVLEDMKDRDEAFNTIIGFSALQWQVCPVAHDFVPQFVLTSERSLCNTVLEPPARAEAIDSLLPEGEEP